MHTSHTLTHHTLHNAQPHTSHNTMHLTHSLNNTHFTHTLTHHTLHTTHALYTLLHNAQCTHHTSHTLITTHTLHTPSHITQVTSSLKEKLSSPIVTVSIQQTAPNNVQTVTKGQSTQSQNTHAAEMTTTKPAPQGENKAGGGRHPNPPPIGSNKKLKHVVSAS